MARQTIRGLTRALHRPLVGRFAQAAAGGGDTPVDFEEAWDESATSGNGFTSFTADGTAGFTAVSDGASVAIIPEDVTDLESDTVVYNFTVDTLSAGSLEFGVDESGVLADDSLDVGAVTRVTGGSNSGARAIFTTTGVKVVYITTKKTNGANALRPKFKYNESAGSVVISGFSATAGQDLDMFTGIIAGFDFDHYYSGIQDIARRSYAFGNLTGYGVTHADKKVGQGSWGLNGSATEPTLTRSYQQWAQDQWVTEEHFDIDEGTFELVTFDGFENVIKFTANSATGANHKIRKYGKPYTTGTFMNFEVYIPSSNTYVDGVDTTTSAVPIVDSFTSAEISPDTWTKLGSRVHNAALVGVAMTDNTVQTGTDWSGDVIYIKGWSWYLANETSTRDDFSWFDLWPEFSVSLWFKANTIASNYYILSHAEDSTSTVNSRFHIRLTTAGEIVAGVRDNTPANNEVTTSGFDLQVGAWHHVYTSVIDGVYLKMWVDGVLIGTADLTGKTTISYANECVRPGIGSLEFNGGWDTLKTWGYAGNQLHVNWEYNSGLGASTVEAIATQPAAAAYPVTPWALWNMDRCGQYESGWGGSSPNGQGARIYDASGNGHHADTKDMPWIYLGNEKVYQGSNFDEWRLLEIPTYTGGLSFEILMTCDGHESIQDYLISDANADGASAKSRFQAYWDVANVRWIISTGNGPSGSNYYFAYFDDVEVNQGNDVKHHLVFTIGTDGRLRAYREGVELTQTGTLNNTSDAYIVPTASPLEFQLFGPRFATAREWHGMIYKAALYEKTLSLAEIVELRDHAYDQKRITQW